MQVFELQGELRTDLGKKATNLLRAEGKVPCALHSGCIHRKSKCSRTELRSCYA